MEWIIIFIVAIFIVVIYLILGNKSKKQQEQLKQMYEEEEREFYEPSQKYGKITLMIKDPIEAHRNYVALIKDAKKIIIHTVDASNWMCDPLIPQLGLDFNNITFDFDDIISYELYSEVICDPISTVSSSTIKTSAVSLIGKATVGAILAGGIGVFIGGMGATRHAQTTISKPSTLIFLYLKVITKTRKHPIYIASYKFHDFMIQKIHWSVWNEYISNIKDVLDEILMTNKQSHHTISESSISDEIKKLHQLMLEGILTENEFNKQKEKLIS